MQFEDFDFFAPANPQASALPEPANRLQYMVDHTSVVIYCTVPSGDFKLTFVSNSATAILGYTPAEMVAEPNFWFDHIHPEDAPAIFSNLATLFTSGERTYEYRFRCANGNYLWLHDALRLMRDENGAAIEVIGSMTDITARKHMEEEQAHLIERLSQAQDQLLQSEKMASIGQLAAGIAHEINNPLGFVNSNMGALQNYVGVLCKVIGDYDNCVASSKSREELQRGLLAIRERADLAFVTEDVGDLVRESLEGIRRVRDIVQALKDFSHVGEAEWQVADLHQGLDTTLSIAANEIKYKANVVKEYGQLPPVECLVSQLNQVFMNLLVNAAQAIEGHGTITIRTSCHGDMVQIAVSDTGSGIAPDHLKRVFEPFFTTKPVGSGTGLGLSLSYGIIHKHGGHIDVSSTVGKGSTFAVHIPVRRATE
jgi:PAS domain S-box-containing protein